MSSVYLWDLEDGGFAGVVLLKKSEYLNCLCAIQQGTDSIFLEAMTPTAPYEPSGSWDSIHVFETAERGRQAHYKLTSTVMLQLVTRRGSEGENTETEKKQDNRGGDRKNADGWKREGEVSLSGSMTRQVSECKCFCGDWLIYVWLDGTRLAYTRWLLTHHQYW